MITPDFMWGVSTSAFQIEGDIKNDMTVWEDLGMFQQPGKNPSYHNAADHWNRWRDDFKLLKRLNVNAYRLSFEWARIQPEPDRFDMSALEQYEQMIDYLHKLEITPMLTLLHFTHPAWFHEISPWHTPAAVDVFTAYAARIVDRFRGRINWFVTLNEPVVWSLAAYADRKFPPGEKNFDHMMRALTHMLEAHIRLYDYIKKSNPDARIGIAKNFIIFRAKRPWNPFDYGLQSLIHTFYNMMLVRAFSTNRLEINFPLLLKYRREIPAQNKIDFWGINYYYRMRVNFRLNIRQPFQLGFSRRAKEGFSDLGWENHSRGVLQICRWLTDTGKPLIITENGIAAEDDIKRQRYLKSMLQVVLKGLEQKYPIRGYFHWSLLDNYEWLEGLAARFGLIHVDYQDNCRRTLKDSARYYADFIKMRINSPGDH